MPSTLRLTRLRTLDLARATHTPRQHHLSAASGLVCAFGRAYVVGDDEHHLAVFNDLERPGQLFRLFDGALPPKPKARKKRKPDTETLLQLEAEGDAPACLVALGSGSRPNRCVASRITLGARGGPQLPAQRLDLQAWYAALSRAVGGTLNIEGATVCGDELVLLQRGHGAGAGNATVHLPREATLRWLRGLGPMPRAKATIRQHTLGQVAGTPLSFTDATALPDGRWLFTAVAEAADDAIADGPCLGSAVGLMSAQHEVQALHLLPQRQKVEGIAARVVGERIEVALVTDHDDPGKPSQLLVGSLPSTPRAPRRR